MEGDCSIAISTTLFKVSFTVFSDSCPELFIEKSKKRMIGKMMLILIDVGKIFFLF